MKYLLIIFIGLLIFGCKDDAPEPEEQEKKQQNTDQRVYKNSHFITEGLYEGEYKCGILNDSTIRSADLSKINLKIDHKNGVAYLARDEYSSSGYSSTKTYISENVTILDSSDVLKGYFEGPFVLNTDETVTKDLSGTFYLEIF